MDQNDRRDGTIKRPQALAHIFDRIADDYEARPGYPDRVFELLVERCDLRDGSRVLEIGPGTGQATLPLLDRGALVTGVEPGRALARRLDERTAGRDMEIVVSAFEDVELPEASFDLAVSATAFHWVDTAVGLAKCAWLLRDGGWLALWWTIWGDPDRADPFHEALEPILRVKAPQLLVKEAGPCAYARDLAARMAQIERVGAYGPVRHETLRWESRHDPVAIRRLFGTFALWLALPEPLRTELLDEVERLARDDFGGKVDRPYLTVLYLAQRHPRDRDVSPPLRERAV